MLKIGLLATATLFIMLVLVGTASADIKNFAASLSGDNEVPPVTTGASGNASFSTNSAETELSYTLNAFNINDVVAAHIHCAAAGVNGPVGVTLFSGGPVGSGQIAAAVITAPNAANGCGWADLAAVISAMESAGTYVNVHTTTVPSGEIRGQIIAVEPVGGATSYLAGGSGVSMGAIVLLASGIAAVVAVVGWYTRRRWLGSRS